MIHYLERKWGVFSATGGTGAIVAALGKLMEEEGVDVRLNTTVASVVVENGAATGVRLEGGAVVPADIVVSDADPMHLFGEMIPAKEQGWTARLKRKTARLSMGLVLLYFGTTGNIRSSRAIPSGSANATRVYSTTSSIERILAEDFSLYIHRPTATDPSFAPEGCDAFYVLCPVPNLLAGIDWKAEAPRLRQRIVAALERTILPGLSGAMRAEMMMTPEDFKTNYLSHAGAYASIAPHFTQSAFFRFHNKAEGIKNLYLTGAGTHPAPGCQACFAPPKSWIGSSRKLRSNI